MFHALMMMWAKMHDKHHRPTHDHAHWKKMHIVGVSSAKPAVEITPEKRDEKESQKQLERARKLANDL